MKHRPEIDGLRAVAVVPVILFHAGVSAFQGGFIGVDVFFVISGFLITGILIEDIEADRFSLLAFYERRARRILPALFLVMAACLPFAWMWMVAGQMESFSHSLIAVSLFASNILFWWDSGYFDSASEEKPLLHTWSLAVEEQYYLIFPLLLFAIWRFRRVAPVWIILGLTGLSLIASEAMARENHLNANFYLAPTRAWELLAGSCAAFLVRRRGVLPNDRWAGLGLALIVISVFAFDETTPVPSLWALAPVIGVVLIVLYAAPHTYTARILSAKPLIGIGLISYSAYLWHQPLFAFARIATANSAGLTLYLGLSVVSLALAWVSWKYVEQPFRNRNRVGRRAIFAFSAAGIVIFCGLGLFGTVTQGFAKRTQLSYTARLDSTIYVIGDSHADHLLHGLSLINSGEVIDMTSAGCIPFRNVDRYDSRFQVGACAETMNRHLDALRQVKTPAVVLISSMGPVYLDGTPFMGKDPARVTGLGVVLITDPSITDRYQVYEIGLRQTLTELRANPNLTIVFALDVPELGIDNGCGGRPKELRLWGTTLRDWTDRIGRTGLSCTVPRAVYDARAADYKALVQRVLAEFPDVLVFDPTDAFCDASTCWGYFETHGYLYRDFDHLSDAGSLYFADQLSAVLKSHIDTP